MNVKNKLERMTHVTNHTVTKLWVLAALLPMTLVARAQSSNKKNYLDQLADANGVNLNKNGSITNSLNDFKTFGTSFFEIAAIAALLGGILFAIISLVNIITKGKNGQPTGPYWWRLLGAIGMVYLVYVNFVSKAASGG
ncbi:hypothetical protein LU293_00265 [Moraxella nasovis]|uniref:hypothetical protein n=1 Tax=Moraxella nasovis TaxID=2904121 RepID=UPI001F6132D7|nr:hypothetical protein [Moraxella nasovis]UNU73387.1 hypothetical protein LU293_00265 [Moraxella nasovis]